MSPVAWEECGPSRSQAETWDDPFLDALAPVLAKYRDTKARREHLALIRAVRLAKDLETCEAILRGEAVPVSRTDELWRKAYGL